MLSCMKTATGQVDVEMEDGHCYEAEVRAAIEHDPDYGADADGNRGVAMDFLVDMEILKVIECEDGQEIESSEDLKARILEKAEANWNRWQEDEYDPY